MTLLVDWHVRAAPFWLQQELQRAGYLVDLIGFSDSGASNATGALSKLLLWARWAILGVRGARRAERSASTVLAWNFVVGAFASLWCRLRSRKGPPVLALNMIAHDKGAVYGATRGIVYRVTLANPKMHLTVNSPELRDEYVRRFGVPASRTHVLRDPWQPHYVVTPPEASDDGYVFAGGRGGRDWITLITAARHCAEIPFRIAASRVDWPASVSLPDNLSVEFDIAEEDFYARASRARLVVVPLLSSVTSGLIVLLRCSLLGRAVVSTDTPATAAYYPEACRDLLVPIGDPEQMASAIAALWSPATARLQAARALQEFVLEEYSPQAFARSVSRLLAEMDRTYRNQNVRSRQ